MTIPAKPWELVVLALLMSIAGFAFGILIATPDPATNLVPQCVTEDSINCHWDAAEQGNGVGRSFVDVNGTLFYKD